MQKNDLWIIMVGRVVYIAATFYAESVQIASKGLISLFDICSYLSFSLRLGNLSKCVICNRYDLWYEEWIKCNSIFTHSFFYQKSSHLATLAIDLPSPVFEVKHLDLDSHHYPCIAFCFNQHEMKRCWRLCSRCQIVQMTWGGNAAEGYSSITEVQQT